jgi:hypothetical protein
VTIIEALQNPEVFGSLDCFRDLGTWSRWLVFLKAIYGLEMTESELEVFTAHTGRSVPRPGGYSEAVAIVGRGAGKTQLSAVLAAFEACRANGRGQWALLIAQDHRSATRNLFRYAADALEVSPVLSGEIVAKTADSLELATGVSIGVYPCTSQSVRGLRARTVVVDELAHFVTSDGRRMDVEMLRAVRPTLVTTGGRLIILSSPCAQSGALYDLHRVHYGKEESGTLVWQASTVEMHPGLNVDRIAREDEDPVAYLSEVMGQFRPSGASAFFDLEDIQACIVTSRRELLPRDGVRYFAHTDPSGGGKDAFALAVAHRDHDRIVLDCLRAWHSKNPAGTVGGGGPSATLRRLEGHRGQVQRRVARTLSATSGATSTGADFIWSCCPSSTREQSSCSMTTRSCASFRGSNGGADLPAGTASTIAPAPWTIAPMSWRASFTGSARRSPHREWDSAGGRARSGGSGRAARSATRGSTTCISLPGSRAMARAPRFEP